MSKARILAISPDSHGVGKYRILDPYKYIGEHFSDEVHVDIALGVENSDDAFNGYDIVILHNLIHHGPHEDTVNRIKWLKSKGVKVVVDTDDLWSVNEKHPTYLTLKQNNVAQKRAELIRLADYVTTTTPIYADKIAKTFKGVKVFVFPNAIDEAEEQFKPKPTESNRVRFGWLGGGTHRHDLELLRSGISTIYNSHKDKAQFVLCGYDIRGTYGTMDPVTKEIKQRPVKPTETQWYLYENIFTNNFSAVDMEYRNFLHKFLNEDYSNTDVPYVRKWTMPISKYATNYNSFDVSLAPLLDNEFNNCKSQLKVIEAGFHKKAIIASEVSPYTLDLKSAVDQGTFNSTGNALLVAKNRDHKQWAQHMKRLIENPNLIEDIGNRLYETVKDTYALKNVSKNRVEFLKQI